MATALSESGFEEGEYESDSDGTSALALRRREASDDEEREIPLDAVSSAEDGASQHPFSDEEGDGAGTPPGGEDEDGAAFLRRRRLVSEGEDEHEGLHQDGSRKSGEKENGSQGTAAVNAADEKEAADEDKKAEEPFVVPTAGAFYMHDDRFRGVAGARPRRGVGVSRKLWEARDEKPWVHDLFEELNVGDVRYKDDALSRDARRRSRGRGRVNRDRNRGWVGKLASDSEELHLNRTRRGRGRGRSARSVGGDHTRVEESGSSTTKATHDGTGSSNIVGQDDRKHHESTALPRKVVAGSLNSASPPFFPSSALQQKSMEGSELNQAPVYQSTKGREKGTRLGSQVFVAKSSGFGRGLQVGGALLSSAPSQQPVKSSSAQTIAPNGRSSNRSSQGQLPLVPAAQPQTQQALSQEAQAPHAVTQVSAGSSPANSGPSVHPAIPKSTGGRVGRGVNTQVVGGRGVSFVYHGGPATGMNNGVQKVEPGFAPAIPAVGPVTIQYGGHPPAGIALPTVGMALPNYPGQPQYGFPNSEVTWIPVLAGGGSIGAGYVSPYMTMEGTPSPIYFSQPSNQPPSFRPSGGQVNVSKPSGLWKPPPNQELGPDEFGHRQSKPRRYSEMNFGQ